VQLPSAVAGQQRPHACGGSASRRLVWRGHGDGRATAGPNIAASGFHLLKQPLEHGHVGLLRSTGAPKLLPAQAIDAFSEKPANKHPLSPRPHMRPASTTEADGIAATRDRVALLQPYQRRIACHALLHPSSWPELIARSRRSVYSTRPCCMLAVLRKRSAVEEHASSLSSYLDQWLVSGNRQADCTPLVVNRNRPYVQPCPYLKASHKPAEHGRHVAWSMMGPLAARTSLRSMSAFQRAFCRRPPRRCTKLRWPTTWRSVQ